METDNKTKGVKMLTVIDYDASNNEPFTITFDSIVNCYHYMATRECNDSGILFHCFCSVRSKTAKPNTDNMLSETWINEKAYQTLSIITTSLKG